MRRSNEPLFWSVFSAGGMVTALLMPGLILVTGLFVPAEWVAHQRLDAIVSNPLGRLTIFGLALLTFFHWAHRFRHVLIDVGLRRFRLPIALGCYLVALAGSFWAGMVALG